MDFAYSDILHQQWFSKYYKGIGQIKIVLMV